MKLILIRHAQAEKADLGRYPDDDLRPLTENGIKLQRKVAEALRAMGLQPNLIISSPRLRTRQTAEITAEILGCENVLEFNDVLGRNYSPGTALDMLTTLNTQEVVMLIGHKPDLSVLGGLLLGPNEGPIFNFHKSAVLGLSFPRLPQRGEGTLEFFFPPENLLALV